MNNEIQKILIEGNYSVLIAKIGFLSAIISVIVSSIVSLLVNYFTNKLEKNKIRIELVKELLKRRFKLYPQLYTIIQNIGKNDSGREEEKIKQDLENLLNWRDKTEGYLILSEDLEKIFDDLVEKLRKSPAEEKRYSKEQMKKIFDIRWRLRRRLKQDLGVIYDSEKNISLND